MTAHRKRQPPRRQVRFEPPQHGDIILDISIGSGTTLLAAERVGRRGYGLELSPLYVGSAVQRWQTYTGRADVLKSTGQTFDALATTRANAGVSHG
jgi:hypothetical protein